MYGDFSRWQAKVPKNQVGILAQEGRILLDADVNAQSLLGMRWQDLAARSAFGAAVAAIPADRPDSWKVIQASQANGTYTISVMPGLAWADGLLVELDGDPLKPVNVTATGPASDHDVLVLDVWRTSLNGYQVPAELIEPALGGPDTAERIQTAYALKLVHLDQGQTCQSIDLHDNLANHGHLSVTIAPTTMTAGDCPVVQGGGYTGLEHDLYRIEIANLDQGGPAFKWSQWNGGLVGRGIYDAATKKLTLIAGDQAILHSDLTAFYLEIVANDPVAGHWSVVYGAPVTLDLAGTLDLSQPAKFGTLPATTDSWFIRLWNDLRPISDFPAGGTVELRDGIRLAFESAATTYVPGDYWTFPVRAGLDNPPTLLANAQPFGPHHHRVPLAELTWNGTTATIHDCRVSIDKCSEGCCTHSVGDGITSHGQFTSVQAAIDALPPEGGEVCVLAGTFKESVSIKYRKNIVIRGCGPRSQIIAQPYGGENFTYPPAIYVLDSSGITIENLYAEGGYLGSTIFFEADAAAGTTEPDGTFTTPFLEDMRVADCTVVGSSAPAIEIKGGQRSELVHNHLSQPDAAPDRSVITVATVDCRIERNVITADTSAKTDLHSIGGVWIRGGSTDITVIDNEITGGTGSGVMLGHIETVSANQVVAGDPVERVRICDNDISQMAKSGIGVMSFFANNTSAIYVADLEIARNRIHDNLGHAATMIGGVAVQGYAGCAAIELADVEDLVMRDNEIYANGAVAERMVAAVYIVHGAGVEFTRNRLYDNAGNGNGFSSLATPRGGIWIASVYPASYVRPALVVRDNEIAASGPSLVAIGVGHFAIADNSLASDGGAVTISGALRIENVFVVNTSSPLQPLAHLTSFSALATAPLTVQPRTMQVVVGGKVVTSDKIKDTELAGAKLTFSPDTVGIEAAFNPPPGSLMFTTNIVSSQGDAFSTSYASAVASTVDTQVTGNQFSSHVTRSQTALYFYGATLRVEDNRMQDNALVYSAMCGGNYVIVTHNIADRCIRVGATTQYIYQQNLELVDTCQALRPLFPIHGTEVKA
ncbi:MAG: right-handed parallel beta-helix repeat-containing protein [Kofleriaceae bacterium]